MTLKPSHDPRRSIFGCALSLILLVAAIGASIFAQRIRYTEAQTPQVRLAVQRILQDIRWIAEEPHPTGTAANAAVRQKLEAKLRALGMQVRLSEGLGWQSSGNSHRAGIAHNIVARLPGRIPGRAVALVAHYDSVPNGNGAAEDAASVAAILETVRALRSEAPLRNDVIVLLTDGEEAGLIGARTFVENDEWAREIALVLNFEFRGNRGPVYMFQTSEGNAALIRGFAQAPQSIGSSLMSEIYRRLPNDTDMTVFLKRGYRGMNFAAIDGLEYYHSPLDRTDAIPEETIAHLFRTMLAVTRSFGASDPAAWDGDDAVYFDAAAFGIVSYPASAAAPAAVFALLAMCAMFVRGLRSGSVRLSRTLFAMLVLTGSAAAAAFLTTLIWTAVCTAHPEFRDLSEVPHAPRYWLGIILVGIGVFAWLLRRFEAALNEREWLSASIYIWLALAVSTARAMPGANFLLLGAALPALILYLLTGSPRNTLRPMPLYASTAAMCLSLIVAAPVILQLFVALGTHGATFPVFIACVVLGLGTPVLLALSLRIRFAELALATGSACLLWALSSTRHTPEHPSQDNVSYTMFDDKAFWVSGDARTNAWSAAVFESPVSARDLSALDVHMDSAPLLRATATSLVPLKPPSIELIREIESGSVRTLSLRIHAVRASPELRLRAEHASIASLRIEGFPQHALPAGVAAIDFSGIGNRTVDATLIVAADTPFRLFAIERSYGLPPLPLPMRPVGTMAGAEGGRIDRIAVFQR